ncbi:hypothetical protein [Nonomuraea rubra]|uniref:hypothetical protein n=1 Tax=Nonomuraea rubra TaxID=46180 RepID=UPI0033D0BCF2
MTPQGSRTGTDSGPVCSASRTPGQAAQVVSGHQPWRVLATGGRDREDKPRIWAAFDDILTLHPQLTVVQGAAYPRPECGVRPDRSADWLIHLWCERNNVTEEEHPADWDTCSTPNCTPNHRRTRRDGSTYCPDAGFWRNGEMVKLGANECVAFPGKGGGTRDCMRQAAAAGIPVRPHWLTPADRPGGGHMVTSSMPLLQDPLFQAPDTRASAINRPFRSITQHD